MNNGLNYGNALYALAAEEKIEDRVKEELAQIKEAIEKNPEFITLLDSPGIELDTRLNIVSDCFTGAHEYLLNFIKILTQERAVHLFNKCISAYNAQYDVAHGIEHVTAVTVVPLTDSEKQKLTCSLQQKRGTKIVLENVIDTSILGGIVLRFHDSQTDASLLGRLNKAKDDLKSITI